jgi:6-phosphogluconate dehydrogenase, C-terminal domain
MYSTAIQNDVCEARVCVQRGVAVFLLDQASTAHMLFMCTNVNVRVTTAMKSTSVGLCRTGTYVLVFMLTLLCVHVFMHMFMHVFYSGMKGTGRWTVQEAAERDTPAPTICAALDGRYMSGACFVPHVRACWHMASKVCHMVY